MPIKTVTYWRQQGAPITPRRVNDLAAIEKWRQTREFNVDRMSVATSNHYLRAVKFFAHWLVRERQTAKNVFEPISSLNAKVDARHERRSLAEEAFNDLVKATRRCKRKF